MERNDIKKGTERKKKGTNYEFILQHGWTLKILCSVRDISPKEPCIVWTQLCTVKDRDSRDRRYTGGCPVLGDRIGGGDG